MFMQTLTLANREIAANGHQHHLQWLINVLEVVVALQNIVWRGRRA